MQPLKAWFRTEPSRESSEQIFDTKSNFVRIFTGDVVEGAVWLVTGELVRYSVENVKVKVFQIPRSRTTWKMHTPA
jgi:hypothetical protein